MEHVLWESQRIGPHENFAAHPGVAYPLDRGLKVKTYDVDYIFYGLAEQALGEYNPGDSPLFSVTFSNLRVTIYRIRDPAVAS
jgi:hypothetical protein